MLKSFYFLQNLLAKIDELCKRGGDGKEKAAVRMEMLELQGSYHLFYANFSISFDRDKGVIIFVVYFLIRLEWGKENFQERMILIPVPTFSRV